MKKGAVIIISITILIIILGLFSFTKLTGFAINSNSCIDSDNNTNYYKFGQVYYNNQIYKDKCSNNNTLIEMTCNKWFFGTYQASQTYSCQYGCSNGACKTQNPYSKEEFQSDLNEFKKLYAETKAQNNLLPNNSNPHPNCTVFEALGTLLHKLVVKILDIQNLPSKTLLASDRKLKAGGYYYGKMQLEGYNRDYLLHVPKNYDGKTPIAVIFYFHGDGETPEIDMAAWGMDIAADNYSRPYMIIWPRGLWDLTGFSINGSSPASYECGLYGRTWSSMWNDIESALYLGTHEDSSYIKAIINELDNNYIQIDKNRIYSTGISRGGVYTFRLACDMSSTFAAIAPVEGDLNMQTYNCNEKRPVPIIAIDGTLGGMTNGTKCEEYYNHTCTDPIDFIIGNETTNKSRWIIRPFHVTTAAFPITSTIDYFTNLYGCKLNSTKTKDKIPSPGENTSLIIKDYSSCKSNPNTMVRDVSIIKGAHSFYPGYKYNLDSMSPQRKILVETLLGLLFPENEARGYATGELRMEDVFKFFDDYPMNLTNSSL